jgi:TonB family protein
MPCHGFGSLSCLVHVLAKRPKSWTGVAIGRVATRRSGESSSRNRGQQAQSAGDERRQLFVTLPAPQSRWKLFLLIWSVQAVAVVCLINLRLFPGMFATASPMARHSVTTLVPFQAPLSREPQLFNPGLIIKLKPTKQLPAVARLVVPTPERKQREPEVKAPELKIESKLSVIPDMPAAKVVVTDTFSTGRSVTATANRPAAKVQTGGFGGPNGVLARDNRGAPDIIALGAFNLPAGSGHGNGSGGANAEVVLNSGFGNGVAIGNPKIGGVVQQSGFDSERTVHESPRVSISNDLATTPVQILSKPNPEYSEEARKLNIDGEVRLEVMFGSSGQAHVVRVIQGLGYGLDEQAVKAAEQIRFKPALHQGQPVDSTAVVRIIFQLAS